MPMVIWKCLVPCSIVAVCTILPLVLAWTPRPANDIDSILSDLGKAENLSNIEIRLNQYLSFLEQISNSNDPLSKQSINAVRFEAASRLSERNDIPGNTAALRQYQQINQVDPSYNHGWLQFLLADTYQKLEQWNETADAYAQVRFYNHSRLALRAKFLEGIVRSEKLSDSVDPFDIYCYLRFVSEYPLSDASITSNWQWNKTEHTSFIKALALYEEGNSTEALQILPSSNDDPCTNYYRVLFGAAEEKSNQSTHDVLQSAYYNGSVVSGSVMMKEGFSLLSDFYVTGDKPGTHTLTLHYTHTFDTVPSFEILVNQSKLDTIQNQPDLHIVRTEFIPVEGKNTIEIRWYNTNQNVDQTPPLTVHVHDIKVQ